MFFVDLLTTNTDSSSLLQIPILRFYIDSKKEKSVKTKNLTETEINLDELLIDGEIIISNHSKRFSIKKDGIAFLENLCVQFSGSYLRATKLREKINHPA